MHLLLDAKLLFLVAFLLLVIITNLVKGYRIHKPRNEPFSLADFVIYSKNRTSEFFGVTKNVYIAFCILGGFFTIIAINVFMEKAQDTGEVVKSVVDDGIQTVDDGLSALKAQNIKMQTDILDIKDDKQDVIDEIQKIGKKIDGKRATSNRQTYSTVEVIETEIISIAPTAPLSDSDVIIKKENSSLYVGETKNTNLKPSSLE